jgi:3-oxoacyl-[acyl-carrier protein] reductase
VLTLEGRKALVTGGSRGIGRACCALLGRLGAGVAIAYERDESAAAAAADEVRAAGARAVAIRADLADMARARSLVDQAVEALGGLDVVVVNHGIWKHAPALGMTDAQWTETLQVNLAGAFAVCQQAARHMAPLRRGAMVLIASTAGQRGEAEHAHYAASKGGVLALTKSLAAELAPHGIRVNCVAPGWVVTDMTREELAGPGGPPALAKIPLGRAATPEEIAAPVAFLASDAASYVYGEVLCANGGAVMAG